jgi:hypothetical protein
MCRTNPVAKPPRAGEYSHLPTSDQELTEYGAGHVASYVPGDRHVTKTVTREMEKISRGPTFGDFVTTRTEGSMQDVTVAKLQSTSVQTHLFPLY